MSRNTKQTAKLASLRNGTGTTPTPTVAPTAPVATPVASPTAIVAVNPTPAKVSVTPTPVIVGLTLTPIATPQGNSPLAPVPYVAPATPQGYVVAKPNRVVTKHDSNDLGRAVTLILQLLPLITENTQASLQIPQLPMLLPSEQQEIVQLLLQAAYKIETATATPANKCKVDLA